MNKEKLFLHLRNAIVWWGALCSDSLVVRILSIFILSCEVYEIYLRYKKKRDNKQ
jgi:hypothetical protein